MHFKEFFGISQIWIASDTNNRIKWVEKWYSCYWVQCEALPEEWKEISNILFRKHDHEHVAIKFLNSKKANKVWKPRDLSRSHDIIRGGCAQKLRRFRIIFHVRCLQTEASPKKNRSVENDSVRFGVKVRIELGVDITTFCIANREHRLPMCNFGKFLDPFDNFNLLSVIKKFYLIYIEFEL